MLKTRKQSGTGIQDAPGTCYSAAEREGGVDLTRKAPSSLRLDFPQGFSSRTRNSFSRRHLAVCRTRWRWQYHVEIIGFRISLSTASPYLLCKLLRNRDTRNADQKKHRRHAVTKFARAKREM